jgi:deoxyadenosine/deoxycytidine kinase
MEDTVPLISPTIIAIEGNIGAGKTTFMRMLEDRLSLDATAKIVMVYEKVDEWMNVRDADSGDDRSLFDLFYADKSKHAFMFQSYVLMSRVADMMRRVRAEAASTQKVIFVCERSFLTDLEVFARILKEDGVMSSMEFSVYESWHRLVRDVFTRSNACVGGQIYLRASPDVCVERIGVRARPGEDRIDDAYIAKLHRRHEQWMLDDPHAPTLIINADTLDYKAAKSVQSVVKQVRDFVYTCL